jgi:hypothetical protein
MTIIFTADDASYRVGDFIVQHKEIVYPPTAPNTTYIFHPHKLDMAELKTWIPLISYRLIVVVDKAPAIPKGLEDSFIIHPSLKRSKEGHFNAINTVFKWSDRQRVFKAIQGVPIPLIAAFLKVNIKGDIETFRRISQTKFFLPEVYTEAIIAYSIKPSMKKTEWPRKKAKVDERDSSIFRLTDQYADIISIHADPVTNVIRQTAPSELPKGVAKRQTALVEWL